MLAPAAGHLFSLPSLEPPSGARRHHTHLTEYHASLQTLARRLSSRRRPTVDSPLPTAAIYLSCHLASFLSPAINKCRAHPWSPRTSLSSDPTRCYCCIWARNEPFLDLVGHKSLNQNKERGPPKAAHAGAHCAGDPPSRPPSSTAPPLRCAALAAGLSAAARHGARTCVASRLPPPAAATPTRRGSVGLSRPRGAAPPLVRVVSLARRCPSGGAGSRSRRAAGLLLPPAWPT